MCKNLSETSQAYISVVPYWPHMKSHSAHVRTIRLHSLCEMAENGNCSLSVANLHPSHYAKVKVKMQKTMREWSIFVHVQNVTLYARKNGHMSTRFEKLVKLSGTNLTQSVYPMITYVQVIHCNLYLWLVKLRYFEVCQTLQNGIFVLHCVTLKGVKTLPLKESVWSGLQLSCCFLLMMVAVVMLWSLCISGMPGWKTSGW